MTQARRPDLGRAIDTLELGELAFLQPAAEQPPPGAPASGGASSEAAARESSRPAAADVEPADRHRVDLRLPPEVVERARELGDRRRTGGRRSLSITTVLNAYVRAVDALAGERIDLQGVETFRDEDVAVAQIKRALTDR